MDSVARILLVKLKSFKYWEPFLIHTEEVVQLRLLMKEEVVQLLCTHADNNYFF